MKDRLYAFLTRLWLSLVGLPGLSVLVGGAVIGLWILFRNN